MGTTTDCTARVAPESAMRASSQHARAWSIVIRLLVFGLLAIGASAQDGRKLIAQPVPVYPELARRARLSGTVKVEILIAANGQVKDVKRNRRASFIRGCHDGRAKEVEICTKQ